MDDFLCDVEFDGGPFDRRSGVQKCLRTDTFLWHVMRSRGKFRLSQNEYRFLSILVQNQGQVVTPEELLHSAFGGTAKRSSNYVRMYINLIRRRVEVDPRNPQHILTEQNRGYRFVP